MIFWLLGRGFSSGWGYWLSPKASLSPKDAFLRDSWDGFLHQHWQSIGWLHVVLFYLSIVLRGFWTRTRTMIQVWTFWAILQNHILKLSNFKSSNWKNPSSPFWDIQKKQPTNLQGNSQKSCLFCSNFSRPQKDVAPFLAIPPAASPFLEGRCGWSKSIPILGDLATSESWVLFGRDSSKLLRQDKKSGEFYHKPSLGLNR